MNNKKATFVLLSILITVAIIYVKSAIGLNTGKATDYNKSTYPLILGSLLIIFIAIDFFQSLKDKAYHIKMSNLLFIVGTIACISLYIILWSNFGYFYLLTFFVLLALLTMYNNQFKVWKAWLINGVISITVTLAIYYIFGTLLNISFS